jgi:hypothetical protein
MSTVIERIEHQKVESAKPQLFQVWIDLNYGDEPSEWWWNTPPKPLKDALEESARLKAEDPAWVTKVLPEGSNPRPDGRWDNPC